MGLLDLLLGNTNPIAQGVDKNRGVLQAIGSGLGQGTDLNTGLAAAARNVPAGAQTDLATNQTAQWLHSQGMDDLVPLALGGKGDVAIAQAMARKQPGYGQQTLAPGDIIRDQTTGKVTYQAPLQSQPIGWGTQGYHNPNTGVDTPVDFGGDTGTTAPGTFGSSAIDPTIDGYSTKVIPGTNNLTRSALDQKATFYITSGTQPPAGRSGAQGQQNAAIANRMAEIDPTGNLASNKSQFGALTSSLRNQQKIYDTVQSSVNAADQGLQQVIGAFNGKVNLSQFPSINAGVNAVKGQLDPGTISAYQGGLQEVANEYSQVFARNGTVTDSVRAKAQSIANGDLSLPDLQKVLNEIHSQGEIVIGSKKAQIKQINDQIAALRDGDQPQSSAAPTAPPASGAPQAAMPTQVLNGVTYTKGPDGNWYTQ